MNIENISAEEALEKLKNGNRKYIGAEKSDGDISLLRRRETAVHGQVPYAAVISCSDSRVIPESIFSAGIGDLFVKVCHCCLVLSQLLFFLFIVVEVGDRRVCGTERLPPVALRHERERRFTLDGHAVEQRLERCLADGLLKHGHTHQLRLFHVLLL